MLLILARSIWRASWESKPLSDDRERYPSGWYASKIGLPFALHQGVVADASPCGAPGRRRHKRGELANNRAMFICRWNTIVRSLMLSRGSASAGVVGSTKAV